MASIRPTHSTVQVLNQTWKNNPLLAQQALFLAQSLKFKSFVFGVLRNNIRRSYFDNSPIIPPVYKNKIKKISKDTWIVYNNKSNDS